MVDPPKVNSVTVEYASRQWWVTISEDDRVYRESFESKDHAENYAAGHRIRLLIEEGSSGHG